jgi:hypothetical protein
MKLSKYTTLFLCLGLLMLSCGNEEDDFDCLDLNANIGDQCTDDLDDVGQIGLDCECVSGILDRISHIDAPPIYIDLGITENSFLYFDVEPLSNGHFVSVRPGLDVQILDSSTFGYPDALELGDIISEASAWSTETNFVLVTSVGSAGSFEDAGERYLGFKITDNEDIYYGWVSLENNTASTAFYINRFWINYNSGEFIEAGED